MPQKIYPKHDLPLTCQHCKRSFVSKYTGQRRLEQKFCSRQCYGFSHVKSPEERFWAKVNRKGPIPASCPRLGRCWLWTASFKNGYGQFVADTMSASPSSPVIASRFTWEIEHGPIGDGLFILHRCDTPACVRISHLFIGTQLDNIRDCVKKKRNNCGEQHYNAKKTVNEVIEIRRRFAAGEKIGAIASSLGITWRNVACIVRRLAWKHV